MPDRTPPVPRWRKGTRALRMRTVIRAGFVPGQPAAPETGHGTRPRGNPERHTCAECFGPRSAYRRGPFCARCELALFGDSRDGYQKFVRTERARRREATKRIANRSKNGRKNG